MKVLKLMGVAALLTGSATLALSAQEVADLSTAKNSTQKKVYRPNYWYIGAEVSSPMVFDDLYSWTNENKVHLGLGLQGKLGYQFSPLFSIEGTLMVGQNIAQPNSYQSEWWLGKKNSYTYYPYTQIDGTTYYHPFIDGAGAVLVGEQGKNLVAPRVDAVPYTQIESRVRFAQAGLKGVLNLTRLFYTARYTEKPVEVLVAPGLYLSRFSSIIRDKDSKKQVTAKVNRKWTWGLGSDLTLRFNLSKFWALDLTGRFVWERDHAIDGVLSAKRAYDAFMIHPGVGLVYKFRKAAKPEDLIMAPATPEAVAPETLLNLDYWYPEAITSTAKKTRKHSASIYLTYVLDQTYLAPELHNNPQELKKIQNEVRTLAENPDYTVKSIKVEGFASPEGPYDNNMRLGEGRARTITNYIISQSNRIDRNMVTLGRMMENWDGLRDTLQRNPNLPGSKEILSLMDNEKDTEVVKRKMQNVKGYKYLLENVFPLLRKSTYEVEYEIRDYDVKDAREVIKSNPSALSPEEMYAVATSYGIGSTESTAALETLQNYYPESDIALLSKAIGQLQHRDYNVAVNTLQAIKVQTPESQNALGVAMAYLGKNAEAIKLFQQAASKSSEARKNLNLLTRLQSEGRL